MNPNLWPLTCCTRWTFFLVQLQHQEKLMNTQFTSSYCFENSTDMVHLHLGYFGFNCVFKTQNLTLRLLYWFFNNVILMLFWCGLPPHKLQFAMRYGCGVVVGVTWICQTLLQAVFCCLSLFLTTITADVGAHGTSCEESLAEFAERKTERGKKHGNKQKSYETFMILCRKIRSVQQLIVTGNRT